MWLAAGWDSGLGTWGWVAGCVVVSTGAVASLLVGPVKSVVSCSKTGLGTKGVGVSWGQVGKCPSRVVRQVGTDG